MLDVKKFDWIQYLLILSQEISIVPLLMKEKLHFLKYFNFCKFFNVKKVYNLYYLFQVLTIRDYQELEETFLKKSWSFIAHSHFKHKT